MPAVRLGQPAILPLPDCEPMTGIGWLTVIVASRAGVGDNTCKQTPVSGRVTGGTTRA